MKGVQYSLASLLEFTLACGALLSSVTVAVRDLPDDAAWVRPVTFLVSWLVLLGVYLRRRYVATVVVHVLPPGPLIVLFGITLFYALFGSAKWSVVGQAVFEMGKAIAPLCFAGSLVGFPVFVLAILGVRSVRRRRP